METPLLRVSRPVSACSRCRNAKIKCDGKLPACSACERSNRGPECSSANDQFARGKERSYVASLESRIERLQKQLGNGGRRKSSTAMLDLGHTQPVSNVFTSSPRRSRRKEASDVDELVADFGYLAVNATARDFHGFTMAMSFAKLVLSTSSVEQMPEYRENVLPQRDVATKILQQCLKGILSLYPVVSKTAVFGSLEAVYSQKGRNSVPHHHWNIRMLLAIAYAAQSQFRDDTSYRDAVRHAGSALEYAESVLQPGSVAGIQAVLLMVLYSMLDPCHFSSWYLIGVASRVMVDLGLHQEPAEELRIKESDRELRRRVFHCVYTLDRTVSITHIRAFSFTDDSANVELPLATVTPLSTFEASENTTPERAPSATVDPALQLIAFRQMQSTWYQALFQANPQALTEPWQHRCSALDEMQRWARNSSDSPISPIKQFFLSEMLHNSILLIWARNVPSDIDTYGQALIFEYAIEYMEITGKLCDYAQDFNYCTNHDNLRALYVGQRLLDILRESPNPAMDAIALHTPSIPKDHLLCPPIPKRSPTENIEAAIRALTQANHVLEVLGSRFGFLTTYGSFKEISSAVLHQLCLKRQNINQSSHAPSPTGLYDAQAAAFWSAPDHPSGYLRF